MVRKLRYICDSLSRSSLQCWRSLTFWCGSGSIKILFCKHYFTPLNTFMRKEKDPDPYLCLMDSDPGGPKTSGSCFGSGFQNWFTVKLTDVRTGLSSSERTRCAPSAPAASGCSSAPSSWDAALTSRVLILSSTTTSRLLRWVVLGAASHQINICSTSSFCLFQTLETWSLPFLTPPPLLPSPCS